MTSAEVIAQIEASADVTALQAAIAAGSLSYSLFTEQQRDDIEASRQVRMKTLGVSHRFLEDVPIRCAALEDNG
jgi:hypothetical protein